MCCGSAKHHAASTIRDIDKQIARNSKGSASMPLDTTASPIVRKRTTACKTLMRQVHAILDKEGSTPSALTRSS
jgi:hypothetical protein